LIAIGLDEGDELGWVRLTHGQDEVILVTELGQALRFSEDEVRSMGRAAGGVTGIKLGKGDKVASLEVVQPGAQLLVVTANGYGKRTPLSEYPRRSRAKVGVQTIDKNALKKVGVITAARVVQEEDDLTIISAGGAVLRTRVLDILRSRRAGRSEVVMSLEKGDLVASLARMAAEELKQAGAI
jgi:DNA gyrase subunit A